MGRGLPFLKRFPVPDGTIDAGDRIQALGWYRGIAVNAPVVPVFIMSAPEHTYVVPALSHVYVVPALEHVYVIKRGR
jgi:hypothetical protein